MEWEYRERAAKRSSRATAKRRHSGVQRRTCRCGADACRTQVTGRDWRRRDVRDRYASHFSPFIERRIAALSVDDGR